MVCCKTFHYSFKFISCTEIITHNLTIILIIAIVSILSHIVVRLLFLVFFVIKRRFKYFEI